MIAIFLIFGVIFFLAVCEQVRQDDLKRKRVNKELSKLTGRPY
jgi:hypothetical protein